MSSVKVAKYYQKNHEENNINW